MSDNDRYRDAHAHPPGFVPVGRGSDFLWSGPSALSIANAIQSATASFHDRHREVVRFDREGKAWIDGKEATDAEIGAAMRAWARSRIP